MDCVKFSSNKFPKLGDQTKKAINNGYWFLYQLNGFKAPYLLIADEKVISLSEDGTIISIDRNRPTDIEYKAYIYFEDLPFPVSLSNLKYA